MTTAEIIIKYRNEHHLSQEQFGEKVGVNRAAVSKWEKGHVKEMKGKNILAVSRLVGVPPYELMGWDEEFNSMNLRNESKLYEKIQSQFGKDAFELLSNFNKLNSIGKENAVQHVTDLTSIPKYIIQEKGDVKAL